MPQAEVRRSSSAYRRSSSRRWAIQAQIDAIEAELAAEAEHAVSHAEAGLYLIGFGPRAPAAALDLMRWLYPDLPIARTGLHQ